MPFTIVQMSEEALVNNTPAGEIGSSVAPLNGGGYVITWVGLDSRGFGEVVYQQLYDANNAPVGSAVPVSNAAYAQHTSVTALNDGGWVVTWEASTANNYEINQQRFNQSGARVGETTRVNTQVTGSQDNPRVTALEYGGWVVTWEDSSSKSIRQQRYGADGNPVSVETQVSPDNNEYNIYPQVSALSDGGWVVTWYTQWQIYQQHYNAGGSPVGSAIKITPDTVREPGSLSSIIGLEGGGWVVAWSSTDGSSRGVYQLRYSQNGDPDPNGPVLVNLAIAGDQTDPVMTAMPDGGWIVTWKTYTSSGADLFQQRFDQAGVRVGGEVKINTTPQAVNLFHSVVALSDDKWVVVWHPTNTPDLEVHSRQFSQTDVSILRPGIEYALGTDADETLSVSAGGLSAGDVLDGRGGADTLLMTASGTLDLTAAASIRNFELVRGSAGNDTIVVNASHVVDLVLDGGGGTNTLSLQGSTFFLSASKLSNFSSIVMTSTSGTSVVVDSVELARLLHGTANNLDSVILNGTTTTFTPEERLALFLNGIETVQDSSGAYDAPAPTAITIIAGGTVAENAQLGASVATLSSEDPDGGTHTYTIVANQNGDTLPNGHPFFAIGTGVDADKIVLKAGLDEPQVGDHDLWIRSRDQHGFFVIKKVRVTVTNVNDEAPTGITISAGGTVAENAQIADAVATLQTQDPDGSGDSHTYTIVANQNGDPLTNGHPFFAIGTGANANKVVLKAGLDDAQVGPNYLWIRSEDQAGLFTIMKITVNVTNVNDAPTDVALASGGRARQGANIGTLVATLSTVDPDGAGDTHTYSLVADVNGTALPPGGHPLFEIEMGTNRIILKAAVAEADRGQYNLWVRSVDQDGLFVIKKVAVTVTEPAVAPSDIQLTNGTVAELAAYGTTVGVLSATDGNPADSFTYTFVNARVGSNGLVSADGRFQIVAVTTATGEYQYEIQVANGFLLDFEQASRHTLKVMVLDGNGLSYTKDLPINISNVATEITAGSSSNDVFKAGSGRDLLRGNAGNDKLYGGSGNDKLYGDAGNDALYGDAGNDILYGGAGNDTLDGGTGTDKFVFDTALNSRSNKDKIIGWNKTTDTICLENAIFKALKKTGTLSASFFTIASKALDANDYIGYNKVTGDLWYDSNGNKAGGQVIFANIGANKAILSTDFVVI